MFILILILILILSLFVFRLEPFVALLLFAQGVALQNIALAIAVVFLSIAILSGFAIAAFVASLVLGTTLGTVGLVRRVFLFLLSVFRLLEETFMTTNEAIFFVGRGLVSVLS